MTEIHCSHADQVQVTDTETRVCPQCIALGDPWVNLRMCLVCGQVGCCDSSKNKHATAHFHATGHPLIRSIQPRDTWVWCYPDDSVVGEIE